MSFFSFSEFEALHEPWKGFAPKDMEDFEFRVVGLRGCFHAMNATTKIS